MRYFAIVVFILIASFGAPVLVSADTQIPPVNTGQGITLINPLGAGTDLSKLVDDILQFVINIGSIVIIFMLVYIGFLFVYYSHTPGKVQEARKALLWTVIGALILLGAKAISLGIQATVQALSTGG